MTRTVLVCLVLLALVHRAVRNDTRLAIDTIPTIVWITTPDGAVEFMNRAWRDFTGSSAEDAALGGWVESLHPDEVDWVQFDAQRGDRGRQSIRARRATAASGWHLPMGAASSGPAAK